MGKSTTQGARGGDSNHGPLGHDDGKSSHATTKIMDLLTMEDDIASCGSFYTDIIIGDG